MAPADVPIFHQAHAEFVAAYADPALERWEMGKLSQALVTAFRPLGVGLERLAFNHPTSNASQVHVRVELARLRAILEVGIGQFRLTVDNPNWGLAKDIAHAIDTVTEIVETVLGATIGRKRATIAFHFSVDGITPTEFIRSFINPGQDVFGEPGVTGFGVSVYREDGHFVLDTSLVYPGALFMSLVRVFPGDTPTEKALQRLYEDEARHLGSLGLKVQ